MKSERETEAPLTPEDVQKILSICSPRGLLVGGQALAFWADHLQVERPANLVSGVTADADFIGDSVLAKDLARRLGWQIWIPALDDSTPQTGKVTHRTKSGQVKQVDFLSGVVGLTTKDLVRRAIEMEMPDIGHLRVIHPIDVLDSRIQNLHLLPEKRTDAGIAQARLAVDVARAFIRQEVATRDERAGLKLLERVADIASDIAAVRVFLLYGIDPLKAVPLEDFRTTSSLHKVRWPQIVAEVGKKRESLRKLSSQVKSLCTVRKRLDSFADGLAAVTGTHKMKDTYPVSSATQSTTSHRESIMNTILRRCAITACVFAALGALEAAAQSGATPCSLLTPAQVSAAVGATAGNGEPIGTTGCTWSWGRPKTTLSLWNASKWGLGATAYLFKVYGVDSPSDQLSIEKKLAADVLAILSAK